LLARTEHRIYKKRPPIQIQRLKGVITINNEILNLAASQGVWAVLSITLVFYILKAQEKRDIKQDEREEKYQSIITNLTNHQQIIESVQKDVEEIKVIIKS